jgi:ABC-type Mn2+/Zn2+ transport system permease subunit
MNWIFVLVCLIAGAWLGVDALLDRDPVIGLFASTLLAIGIYELVQLLKQDDPFDVEMREDEE